MRDGYLRGALSPKATQRQIEALAAFVVAGGSVDHAAELVGIRPSTVKRHCETECPVHGWAGSPDWSRQRRG
jgi:hypothetical protein